MAALIIAAALCAGIAVSASAGPTEVKVGQEARIVLHIWDFGPPDTVHVFGDCDILFSDPFPDPLDPEFLIIETEIIALDLKGPGIKVGLNDGLPSPGKVKPLTPGIDFPAESFFDVFFQIELDGMPGDTLVTYAPIHISSIIDQWPPYFENYESDPMMPPVPVFRKDGIQVGEFHYITEEIRPYYAPRAHLHVPTAYMSDVAVAEHDGPMEGMIKLSTSVSGCKNCEILEAVFAYRHEGDTGPFTDFWIDPEGWGPGYKTIYPLGPGDGFCGYFDPGSEPFEGQVVEFESRLFVPPYGYLRDTVIVFVDPTPPIPEFENFDEDSVGNFAIDSFFDITYKIDDEFFSPGTAELLIYPISFEYHRDLTEIDQLGLGTDYDSTSCAPTAAASCLKYFADNGHGELDNPNGDEAKPEQSGEEMARELQDAMGTDENGTTPDGMVSGIESYLEGHGQSGWSVEHGEVSDATGLGEMIREFESDGEDILMLVQDTTAAGDTIGHVVTLGSVTTTYYEAVNPPPATGNTDTSLDFMDPWGGGSTEDNDYETGENDEGQTTLEGYDLDGAGGDGWVSGYIKVSPPEDGGSSPPIDNASLRSGWIQVDTGIAHGNGIIDFLTWDTTPFAGGLYLMEIVTTDDQGITCRDLRLAGIPAYTVDDDSPSPPFKTNLRGSYPNPFNPATTIEYSLERETKVTLVIYDVSGRKVRTLLSAKTVEAGIHRVDWDGKNDKGKQLSSGIYFCKFLAAGQVEAKKLILLR